MIYAGYMDLILLLVMLESIANSLYSNLLVELQQELAMFCFPGKENAFKQSHHEAMKQTQHILKRFFFHYHHIFFSYKDINCRKY